jgi:class 3 adenylate cyclase
LSENESKEKEEIPKIAKDTVYLPSKELTCPYLGSISDDNLARISSISLFSSLTDVVVPMQHSYPDWLSDGVLRITSPKEEQLADEIAGLRKQLAEQTNAAVNAQKKSGQAEKELEKARRSQEELLSKERLNFVVNRIHPEARAVLFGSDELQRRFLGGTTCEAYVMSIDIRRSTDLMLKTRRPELFARFISELCGKILEIVITHNGVFDKFTGDGVLAFFPDFYSGLDAGYSVVAAADAAHHLFKRHYDSNRQCFISIIKDVGLGIGIDQGTVNLVRVGDGLTVVGTPVVYACRMGAAPAGITLLNQPAYEKIFEAFSEVCSFDETELDVKHEGRHLAYSVRLNGKTHAIKQAGWRTFDKGAG